MGGSDFGMTRAKAITSGQDMSTMLMTDCGTPCVRQTRDKHPALPMPDEAQPWRPVEASWYFESGLVVHFPTHTSNIVMGGEKAQFLTASYMVLCIGDIPGAFRQHVQNCT